MTVLGVFYYCVKCRVWAKSNGHLAEFVGRYARWRNHACAQLLYNLDTIYAVDVWEELYPRGGFTHFVVKTDKSAVCFVGSNTTVHCLWAWWNIIEICSKGWWKTSHGQKWPWNKIDPRHNFVVDWKNTNKWNNPIKVFYSWIDLSRTMVSSTNHNNACVF